MNITHVGIYAGNGMVIDASSSRGMVVYKSIMRAMIRILALVSIFSVCVNHGRM